MTLDRLFPELNGKPLTQAASAGLCLYALGLPASISAAQIGLGLAFIFTLAAAWRGELDLAARLRRLWSGQFIMQSWLFYAAAAVVTAAAALFPERGFRYLTPDLLKPVTCIFLLAALEKSAAKLVLGCLLTGAALAALCGLADVIAVYAARSQLMRANFSGSYTFYGEMAVFAFCYAAALICRGEDAARGEIRAAMALSGLLVTAVMFSQTRSAIVGLAAVFPLFWAMEKRSRRFLLASAVSALLCIGILSAAKPGFARRIYAILPAASALAKTRADAPVADASISNRFGQWAAGLRILRDYPFLGVGPNNFMATFDFYHPGLIDGRGGWTAHNLYIEQAAERGIVGLAALLCVLGALIYCALRLARGAADPYSLAALAALLAFLPMTITGETLQETRESGALFLLLAGAYAYKREETR
ncbi:MAG: O-antigen ligase family protein [Elusimicrobiales bacterium]|nr:O-antigen ligase family protein [Elusimicrobiales bacterium]